MTTFTRKPTLPTLAVLLLAAAAPGRRAEAQSIIDRPYGGSRPYQLDVHAGFTYYGRGLATGARFGIPIVHNGFVKTINNSIHINFGLDLYYVDYVDAYAVGLGIPVTMHWEFYFTPRWTAFGEVGPNIYFHPGLVKGDGWAWSGRHWISLGAGARYMLSEGMALTLRLGSPYSSFGVSFMF